MALVGGGNAFHLYKINADAKNIHAGEVTPPPTRGGHG